MKLLKMNRKEIRSITLFCQLQKLVSIEQLFAPFQLTVSHREICHLFYSTNVGALCAKINAVYNKVRSQKLEFTINHYISGQASWLYQ